MMRESETDMVVLSQSGESVSRGWERRDFGNSEERFPRCLLGRRIEKMLFGAGSLYQAAPSRAWLLRERGLLQRPYNHERIVIFSIELLVFLCLVFCLLFILT